MSNVAVLVDKILKCDTNSPMAGNNGRTYEIGKISSWNIEKGFGFITPKSGGKSVFIHIKDFSKRHKRPIQGLSVVYSLSEDNKGRLRAENVYPEKGNKRVTKAPFFIGWWLARGHYCSKFATP